MDLAVALEYPQAEPSSFRYARQNHAVLRGCLKLRVDVRDGEPPVAYALQLARLDGERLIVRGMSGCPERACPHDPTGCANGISNGLSAADRACAHPSISVFA
ncbi:hypothetical protein GCM10023087_16680 [Microbacterium rhizosphaerae]